MKPPQMLRDRFERRRAMVENRSVRVLESISEDASNLLLYYRSGLNAIDMLL